MAKREMKEELEPCAAKPAAKREKKEGSFAKREMKEESDDYKPPPWLKEEVKQEVTEGRHEGSHGASSSSPTPAAAVQPNSSIREADAILSAMRARGQHHRPPVVEKPWRWCHDCGHKAYLNKHYWKIPSGWCIYCWGQIG